MNKQQPREELHAFTFPSSRFLTSYTTALLTELENEGSRGAIGEERASKMSRVTSSSTHRKSLLWSEHQRGSHGHISLLLAHGICSSDLGGSGWVGRSHRNPCCPLSVRTPCPLCLDTCVSYKNNTNQVHQSFIVKMIKGKSIF